MSMLRNTVRVATLGALMLVGACGGDDDTDARGSTLLDAGLDAASAPQGAVGGDAGVAAPAVNPLYLIGANVQTSNESVLYLFTTKQFEGVKLDLKQASEMTGASSVVPFNGHVYIDNSDKKTITRYDLKDDKLVAGPTVSFLNEGLKYLSYMDTMQSPERAFIVNDTSHRIIEWNPTTMTITKTHDIAALRRVGWGNEYRGGFVRSDGKIIMYWAYTNNRTEFLNNFVVGVWDSNTGALTIEEDPTCPSSAGFGGYFDENEDLYLIADSFGMFTQFGGFKDPKPACILRVKKGESKLDPTYKQHPSSAMGGAFPWGFYYLGNGVAFTSGIDPATPAKYNSVFETLFAKEHSGWLLDTKAGTARKIENLPRDGVGFESHRMDGRLFVPRTGANVVIENIMSSESTLFEIRPDATAVPMFSLPGYISPVARIR